MQKLRNALRVAVLPQNEYARITVGNMVSSCLHSSESPFIALHLTVSRCRQLSWLVLPCIGKLCHVSKSTQISHLLTALLYLSLFPVLCGVPHSGSHITAETYSTSKFISHNDKKMYE